MYLQTKAYKFNATKKEVHDRMARLSEESRLKGYFINENNFLIQKKYNSFFKIEGDISELESNHKIKISISTKRKYLLIYILPAILMILGIIQWSGDAENPENGWFLFLGGISFAIFIYLVSSAIIGSLKNSFKVEFQLI